MEEPDWDKEFVDEWCGAELTEGALLGKKALHMLLVDLIASDETRAIADRLHSFVMRHGPVPMPGTVRETIETVSGVAGPLILEGALDRPDEYSTAMSPEEAAGLIQILLTIAYAMGASHTTLDT